MNMSGGICPGYIGRTILVEYYGDVKKEKINGEGITLVRKRNRVL